MIILFHSHALSGSGKDYKKGAQKTKTKVQKMPQKRIMYPKAQLFNQVTLKYCKQQLGSMSEDSRICGGLL